MSQERDLAQQVRDLQTKLDTLRAALCKRCKQIDIDNPQNLRHLQQCYNARKSISHVDEAADIITNDADLVPLDDTYSFSHKRKRKKSISMMSPRKAKIEKAEPAEVYQSDAPISPKPNRKQNKESKPNLPPLESDKVKRASSASEIFTKFRRPFKRKSKLAPSESFPSSSSPVTTGSGVLIPKLELRSSSLDSDLGPKAYNGPPVILKERVTNSPLRPKGGESDEDDENTEQTEKDMPDDEEDDNDTLEIKPTAKKLCLSSDSGSSKEHSFVVNQQKLSSLASQLLALRQRLLEKGVNESNLRELVEISEILVNETYPLKVTPSNSFEKRSKQPKEINANTERFKKLFKKSKDLDLGTKQSKKELPEHEAWDLTASDPFGKRLQRAKKILTESKYHYGCSTRSRSRSLRVNDLEPITVSYNCKRRRTQSFETLYSWEMTPSYHYATRMCASRPDTPRQLFLTLSDVGSFELQSGNVLALFQWILSQPRQNVDEIQAFLLIYRRQMTPAVLLNILIKKWEESARCNTSVSKIIFILEQWIERYFMADFAPNRLLSQQLWHFIGSHFKNTDGFRMLTQSWFNQHFIRVQECKLNPTLPSIHPICKIDVLSDSPIELARQLTLIEFTLWERIHIFDYLLEDLKESKPINDSIDRFNRVSSWVATEIIKVPQAKKRAFVIKQFISIAQACFEMNNFNTLLEITAGLNLVPIRRLRKTWRHVPKRFTDLLDELEDVMDHHQNYKRYRRTLRDCSLPCLPYLGVIRRDITMIQIGNKDIVQRNYLNFEKGKLMWEVLREVVHLQQTPYRFQKIPPVYNALNNLFVFDEHKLYQFSLEWEPSEAHMFDDD